MRLNELEMLRARVARLEVTPEHEELSPVIKSGKGTNAVLGNIAFAGSVLESSYNQIEDSRQVLVEIFKKHGKEIGSNLFEIQIPEDQYLLVETVEENFTVEVGGWVLMDTNIRKFPANRISYTHGGSFGQHRDANLRASGIKGSSVEIKNGHKLSLRQLPEGVTFEEFFSVRFINS